MSYTPTEWKSGDTVTSAKLNKLEQGVATASGGGGVLVVGLLNGTLNKTWAEIRSALLSGIVVVPTTADEGTIAQTSFIVGAETDGTSYTVQAIMFGGDVGQVSVYSTRLETDSENGYPTYHDPNEPLVE